MNMETDVAPIPGYQLVEQLYCGSRTIVYRAVRESDGKPIAIKFLKREYPTFNELLHFRNQYTIARSLDIPGIIHTYSLEPYRNSYALVMEDGGTALQQYIKIQKMTWDRVIHIAIQMAEILHQLHQNRVIHKDIKPANILIDPKTQKIKLIDFSISSLLPKEMQEIKNPNVLEGTLAYLSPEQTGRMNRGVDYRSDFYSFGVTLFELLAEELPFISKDPMELVHCHIAKSPKSVCEYKPEIPKVVGQIVSKLMAKNAEERYQSALGIKYDLECCLAQLQATGTVEEFPLGQKDVSDRFLIPEKLYGRDREVKLLLEAFDRVSQGTTELMLVAGFSGIGKTAIINEVHKPIVRQRGYFIKGKFDQFNRNIPFSAFVQAFRDLMGQLLGESDERLQQWKMQILNALGDNGQVIVEVIPEVERIIGPQPPAPELSGIAAQTRFNLLFRQYIEVFTTPESPLVIFLDDLQWADLASLKLLQMLMDESHRGYFLILGAYRDNEVSPTHSLTLTLEEIGKAGAKINTLTLSPLNPESINQFVAATLICTPQIAQPLTDLIYLKTKGNPFFATQFLKALHQDRLIDFDMAVGYWQCDISKVREAALTEDVVEFMAQQLQKLSSETQNVLKLAACIGNQFDLTTLAIVSEQSEVDTAIALWKGLQEGLILPQSEIYKFYVGREQSISSLENSQTIFYKFLHDRVQQAAYSLIPKDRGEITHLKIGRSLLQNFSEQEREERIFEIVNQCNKGAMHITSESEKDELSNLNLLAGHKAKSATAYAAALEYLTQGIELLGPHSWQRQYTVSLRLHKERAEAEYLNGDFAASATICQGALEHAKSSVDKAEIYNILIVQNTILSQYQKAIEIGKLALALFGVQWSEKALDSEISSGFAAIKESLKGREIQDLIELPEVSNPEHKSALKLLHTLLPTAYSYHQKLWTFLVVKMVWLSLQYGHVPECSFGYAFYGTLLNAVFDDYQAGYEFGKLALQLSENFNNIAQRARACNILAAFLLPWKRPIQECEALNNEGYKAAWESGQTQFVGYIVYNKLLILYHQGTSLSDMVTMLNQYLPVLDSIKHYYAENIMLACQLGVWNLSGKTESNRVFQADSLTEEQFLGRCHEQQSFPGLCVYKIIKGQILYLYDDFVAALEELNQASQYLAFIGGHFSFAEHTFYQSLCLAALYPQVSAETQTRYWEQLERNQEKIELWMNHCPENFRHKYLLVSAELARITQRKSDAYLYDRAIESARSQRIVQDEALAHELAAKFYLELNKEKVAQQYLIDAYYCYIRWGAKTKIDDLEQRYSHLLKPILCEQKLALNPLITLSPLVSTVSAQTTSTIQESSSSSDTSISAALDLATILKTSQTLSSEIHLEKLMTTFMQILLQNAGAQKGALLLPKGDRWMVDAIADLKGSEADRLIALPSVPLDGNHQVPQKLIYAVKNTLQPIVIQDLTLETVWSSDLYLSTHQPKSCLCLPIFNQRKLIAILYLENHLTVGAFTSDRLELINLLCVQAAISLENARLYQKVEDYAQSLEEKVEQRTAELKIAQQRIIAQEKLASLGTLTAGVAHELRNPLNFVKNYAEGSIDLTQELTEAWESISQTVDSNTLQWITEILNDLRINADAICHHSQRAERIIQSMMQHAHTDSEMASPQPTQINELLEQAVKLAFHSKRAQDQQFQLTIETDYHPDLQPIDLIPSNINRAFINLVENACDAVRLKYKKLLKVSWESAAAYVPTLQVRTRQVDQQIEIRLRDNGCGIGPEAKAKIWDPFFTTKPPGEGTGLGLSLTYDILVNQHQGNIVLDSIPDEYTEVVVNLPLHQKR